MNHRGGMMGPDGVRGMGTALILVLFAVSTPACAAEIEASAVAETDIDQGLGEVAWPGEDALAVRIAEAIRGEIAQRYPPETRPALRDAHPKAHGCVRAELQVDAELDPALATGVFAPGARYPAWIRFSNGNADASRPDIRGDARGMAIKLMNVVGEKLLPAEKDAQTQDFVLITHPVFFADDPLKYAKLIERGTSSNPLVQLSAPFALGWKGLGIARAIQGLKIASPLETRYWSTVPFQHGIGPERRAVKYSTIPCLPGSSVVPDDPSPDYLHDVLASTLREREMCFEFRLQVRAGTAMSVEDSRTEWLEEDAPFVRVARLVIPTQTLAPEAFCEDLSFTPWHSLPEHRPLGGVNRIRRVVYQSISDFRHELNGTERSEPLPTAD